MSQQYEDLENWSLDWESPENTDYTPTHEVNSPRPERETKQTKRYKDEYECYFAPLDFN